ncbi:hypothetical protein F4859DRAFT_136986 [Xylaria cf. heliscus]|nr:hypothetical protein F4859DRAFT_136986 [Xylaria cf. heliscus]
MSQGLAQPEVSAIVKRKYGPYDVKRFNNLFQVSVGAADLGKVHVDCKFLFKKSQWGTLENRKAGIIYLDLTFSQPGNCRLSSAIIQVTLDDEDKYLRREFLSDKTTSLLNIRNCGPRELLGSPRYETVVTRNKLAPKADAPPFRVAGGVEHESVKSTVRDYWWRFDSYIKTNNKTNTGPAPYKVLQWHINENELLTQPLHSNTFHTAFSFEHGCQPLFMHVEISGELKSKTSDFRHKFERRLKNLKFPPSSKVSRYTTTLIHFKEPDIFTTPLDEVENRLEQDMQLQNMTHPLTVLEAQGQTASENQRPAPIEQSSIRPLVEE